MTPSPDALWQVPTRRSAQSGGPGALMRRIGRATQAAVSAIGHFVMVTSAEAPSLMLRSQGRGFLPAKLEGD